MVDGGDHVEGGRDSEQHHQTDDASLETRQAVPALKPTVEEIIGGGGGGEQGN